MIAWAQAVAPLVAVEKAAGSPWLLGVLGATTVGLLAYVGGLLVKALALLTSLAHTLHGTAEEQASGTSHGLIATVQAMQVSLEDTAHELRETRAQTKDELREAAASRESATSMIGRAIDAIALRQEQESMVLKQHESTLTARMQLFHELKSEIAATNARIDDIVARPSRPR